MRTDSKHGDVQGVQGGRRLNGHELFFFKSVFIYPDRSNWYSDNQFSAVCQPCYIVQVKLLS